MKSSLFQTLWVGTIILLKSISVQAQTRHPECFFPFLNTAIVREEQDFGQFKYSYCRNVHPNAAAENQLPVNLDRAVCADLNDAQFPTGNPEIEQNLEQSIYKQVTRKIYSLSAKQELKGLLLLGGGFGLSAGSGGLALISLIGSDYYLPRVLGGISAVSFWLSVGAVPIAQSYWQEAELYRRLVRKTGLPEVQKINWTGFAEFVSRIEASGKLELVNSRPWIEELERVIVKAYNIATLKVYRQYVLPKRNLGEQKLVRADRRNGEPTEPNPHR